MLDTASKEFLDSEMQSLLNKMIIRSFVEQLSHSDFSRTRVVTERPFFPGGPSWLFWFNGQCHKIPLLLWQYCVFQVHK